MQYKIKTKQLYLLPFLTITGILLFLIPSTGFSCSVCFTNSYEVRWAFYSSILLMGLLPPLMVGGIAFWIFRKIKLQREQINNSDSTHKT